MYFEYPVRPLLRAVWGFVGILGVCACIGSPAKVTHAAPLLGVGVHTVTNESNGPRVMEHLAGSGLTAVREEAPWKFVETTKGTYQIPPAWDRFVDGVNANGMKLILVLDYGNRFYDGGDKPRSAEAIAGFVRYATFVIEHFAGRIKYYEIWNEWDNTTGGFPPGTPAEYAALFNATFPALKRADPSAVVLLGSGIQKPQFYEALAKLGAVGMADGVSIHPYNYDPAFGPEISADFLIQFEEIMKHLSGRPQVDIYVTEIGWPTPTSGFGVYSDARQAEYAYRTVLLFSALPYIKGVWWYDLKDDGQNPSDREDHFGLSYFDWSPKPSWKSFTDAVEFSRTHELALADQSNLKQGRALVDVKNRDGSKSEIVWNFHNVRPSLYARCVPRVGSEVATEPGDSETPIRAVTLIALRSGTCSAVPLRTE
jgi:hypothetical protein